MVGPGWLQLCQFVPSNIHFLGIFGCFCSRNYALKTVKSHSSRAKLSQFVVFEKQMNMLPLSDSKETCSLNYKNRLDLWPVKSEFYLTLSSCKSKHATLFSWSIGGGLLSLINRLGKENTFTDTRPLKLPEICWKASELNKQAVAGTLRMIAYACVKIENRVKIKVKFIWKLYCVDLFR